MSHEVNSFSSWRSYFWPIHSKELYKILPIVLIGFFIGFNYNILRTMKDALLITAKDSGAEVIPFIKVWGILPAAIFMTYLYSRLHNRLGRDRLFIAMISIFLLFFLVFTFVFYPLREYLHPHQTADFLQEHLPRGLRGLIAMFRYWTFSAFYIMSELWSSAILSMLFWGFTNEVIRIDEAKRFYGIVAIGLNISAITGGQTSVFLTSSWVNDHFHFSRDEWYQSIVLITCTIILSGIAIILIYRYFAARQSEKVRENEEKKNKIKMSMRENFAYLAKSRYLLSLAVIVLSYNIIINLVEVIWKDQVKQLYPDPRDFNAYMGQITTCIGILSFLTSFLISGQIIRKFGWTFAALLTPAILLIACIGFFTFLFGADFFGGLLAILGTTPLVVVVFFGSVKNCLCRAAKYTVFDATKEIAFVPLSTESKRKGKAAIDGVGSRLGKSGGALIHQSLLVIFSSVAASAHIVAAILIAVTCVWIYAVLDLGKRFQKISTDVEESSAKIPVPQES